MSQSEDPSEDGAVPSSDSDRARSKQATWRRILAAARIVFARDGYVDATLAEVAREADIGKSTLYRHVDSKADLLFETLVSRDEDPSEWIARILDADVSAEEQLRALGSAFFEFTETHPDYRPILWAIDNQDLIGDLSKRLVRRAVETWQPQIEAVTRVVERGVARGEFRDCDPHLAAHLVWNWSVLLLDLQYSPVRRQMMRRPLERFFEEGLETLVRGLRADSGGGAEPGD
ncbi:MAG: TetR/AcrR family transcriptional regulator [Myxococcota bacterium]